jgi:tetratricopeptide (TPR) repeat protein
LTAPGWFEIHDLVRDYAVELLEQEEGPATRAASRRRLLSWYAHSAEAACLALGRYSTLIEVGPLEPGVRPDVFADPAQALAWFARHRRALTELVHRAAGEEDHATVHRLVPRLGYNLSRLSAAIEELALQRMALASARALGTDEAIGGAANNLGIAYGRLGRYPEAMESFDTAERHCTAAKLRLGVLRVRDNVATVLTLTGRPEEAIGMLEQNLADLGGPPDSAESIATLNNLANGYLAVGRYADAVATAQRCRAAAREARRPAEEALALDGLGSVYLRLGEPERACSAFRKALALSRQGGDRPGEARVRMELGEAHLAAGRPDQARRDWTACLQLLDDMGAADLPRVRREEVRGRLADLERQVEPTG